MKKVWQWMKDNIFVKDMFVFILFGAIIFYIPAWGSIILGMVLHNEFIYAFAGTYVLVWAGPFTPTVPAIMAIAVFLKTIYKKFIRSDDDEAV